MKDFVKMSRATLGILMAQNKILAETIDIPEARRYSREGAKKLMDRKLLYLGQEIILDDTLAERQILAAEAPPVKENRFSPRAGRATIQEITKPEKAINREIQF